MSDLTVWDSVNSAYTFRGRPDFILFDGIWHCPIYSPSGRTEEQWYSWQEAMIEIAIEHFNYDEEIAELLAEDDRLLDDMANTHSGDFKLHLTEHTGVKVRNNTEVIWEDFVEEWKRTISCVTSRIQ